MRPILAFIFLTLSPVAWCEYIIPDGNGNFIGPDGAFYHSNGAGGFITPDGRYFINSGGGIYLGPNGEMYFDGRGGLNNPGTQNNLIPSPMP